MPGSPRFAAIASAILLLSLSPITVVGQDDDESAGNLYTVYDLHVRLGHEPAFREGMAAWKNCYTENDGKETWTSYRRMQGKGIVYSVVFSNPTWEEMGKRDPATQACQSILRERIDPHLDAVETMISRFMPGISGEPGTHELVEVYSFDVADASAFTNVVEAVTEVMREDGEGLRGWWHYTRGGGPGTADFFVVDPFEDFAAMDEERSSPWARYAAVHGEDAAAEMRAKFRDAVDDDWSYIYRRIAELSSEAASD
ncbi:MAG: hypothetical protein ACNS61_12685 [Candidatus Wenzhouxiangella sp. M2_3B_020]